MLKRFKSWLIINAITIPAFLLVLVGIYFLTGLPIVPGVFLYLGITLTACVLFMFFIAHEDDTTVRCGLFGHKMLNVRLEGGGYDSEGNPNPAIRVYACKRCGGEVTVEQD